MLADFTPLSVGCNGCNGRVGDACDAGTLCEDGLGGRRLDGGGDGLGGGRLDGGGDLKIDLSRMSVRLKRIEALLSA